MKHLIFEGVDRIGKDTLIKNILNDSHNYIVRHFTIPEGDTAEEMIKFQKSSFLWEFRYSMLKHKIPELTKTPTDYLIWNRAHIGEKVYGKMFRNYDADWIYEYESLFGFHNDEDVYLILLTADADFAFSKEDGKSLSNTLEQRQQEINLFDDAFEKSTIMNKLRIKVNEGNDFLPSQQIYEQVHQFIHKKQH